MRLSNLCCLGDGNEDNHNDIPISRAFPRPASALLDMLYDQVRAEETAEEVEMPLVAQIGILKEEDHILLDKEDDVTQRISEYLFRESCGPWLAGLTNRLFDHTRSIDHNGEVKMEESGRNQTNSTQSMPSFVDLALRRSIVRAAWSLRVLRESPQDIDLRLYRCCWSFFNDESDVGRTTVSETAGTSIGMVPRGATREDVRQHRESVQILSSLRFSTLLRLIKQERGTAAQRDQEMSAKKRHAKIDELEQATDDQVKIILN